MIQKSKSKSMKSKSMKSKSKTMKKTMKKTSKSGSFSIVESVKRALQFLAPKSFGNYDKCMENKCKKEYNAYFKAVPKLHKKIHECHTKNIGNSKKFRKCTKTVIKGLKEFKDMNNCAKKHCKSEKKSLEKESKATVKKIKNSVKKHMKSAKSKSKSKSSKSSKSSKK